MQKTVAVQKKVSVGKRLKTARLEKGLTLDAVAKMLCITKAHLKNIEEHCDTIEHDVYITGFIRSYSELLHLNADEIVRDFKALQSDSPKPQVERSLNFPEPLPYNSVPRSRILMGSAALAILVGFLLHQFSGQKLFHNPLVFSDETSKVETVSVVPPVPQVKAEDEPVHVPEEEEAAVAEEEEPSDMLAEEETPSVDGEEVMAEDTPFEDQDLEEAAPVPVGNTVLLKATEPTWVEVRNLMGDIVVSKVFRPGETFLFTVRDDLILKTGNAGGIILTVGDRTSEPLGETGQVMNHISLRPEKLLAQFFKNQ